MADAPMLVALHIHELQSTRLDVIECIGRDTLSTPYEFTILCSSEDQQFDASSAINLPATLRLQHAEWENTYSGLIFSFQKIRSLDGLSFYKATLAPRLKLLELTRHNQVFLDKTLPQIVESVLRECDILHYELRLMGIYEPMEYVCQYNETHFNFLSRWLEHAGLYYFFEETPEGEKLVITDTKIAHVPVSDQAFPYRLASGLDEQEQSRSVFDHVAEHTIIPKTVVLKDYNPQHPNLDLLVEVEVDPQGVGRTYHYGDHFQTVDQGRSLAKVRAEELACQKTVHRGQSGCLPLRAGGQFTLSGHPDTGRNTAYLTTSVRHEARQTRPLTSGLDPLLPFAGEFGYRNAFTAGEASVQFRPARLAEKTRITGMLCARIDAEGSGQYAELDSQGRYKVRLPFDLAGEPDGHASSWLRLAEPYAGANYGMHFPLHKATEVMLAFFNADPDRPVIASSLHNAENKNPIADTRAKLAGIKTAGKNQLVFNDTEGQEYVGLWSPYHSSGLVLGSVEKGGGGSLFSYSSGNNDKFIIGNDAKLVFGTSTSGILGLSNTLRVGSQMSLSMAASNAVNIGADLKINSVDSMTWDWGSSTSFSKASKMSGQESVQLSAGYAAFALPPLAAFFTLFGLSMAGAAATFAGSVWATKSYSHMEGDGFITDDEGSKHWGGIDKEIGLGTAGLLAAAGVVAAARIFMKRFLNTTGTLKAAYMSLDNTGIKMLVNNTTAPGAAFDLSVGATIPGVGTMPTPSARLSSSLKISATGDTMTLSNMGTNSLKLNPATGITLQSGVYDPSSKVTLNMAGIEINNRNIGKLGLSAASTALGHGVNPGLKLTNVDTTLSSPNDFSSICLDGGGIEMSAPRATLEGQSQVQINGALIQVG